MIDGVVEVGGCRLRTRTWGESPASIVMLHDGLGSVTQWRDLPERVHERTGRSVLAYDRSGHGESTPIPAGPWPADWMHTEADVLAALLASSGSNRPLLVGHSDGASISLIHASASSDTLEGVVALAPHSYVEQRCVDEISAMRTCPQRLVTALADHHDDPAAIFEAWSGAWVSPAFRDWDIRGLLGSIGVPTLVLQGDRDAYATEEMLWSTVGSIGSRAEGRLLAGLGHLLHHDAPELMCDLISGFAG